MINKDEFSELQNWGVTKAVLISIALKGGIMKLKRIYEKIFFIIGTAVAIVSFQNCGQAFHVADLNNVHTKVLDQASLGGVKLAWDRTTTNEDGSSAAIHNYKIYITNDDNYSRIIESGDVTEHRVTGLESGETYHFSIAAVSEDGSESNKSSEISYKVR